MPHSSAQPSETLPSSIGVDTAPSGLDVDTSSNLVFVDGQVNGTITIIDGLTGSIVEAALPLGGTASSTLAPHGVAVDSTTHTAYVANQGNSTVSVVSAPKGTWSVTTVALAANSQPHGIAVNAVTQFVYVANQGTNTMSVIDVSLSPPAEIANSPFGVGNNPHGIGVDSANNLVFVANRKDGTVSIFTGASRDGGTVSAPVLASTPIVGASSTAPTGIGVNASASKAYVSLFGSGSVVVMDYGSPSTPENPKLTTISNVGSGPDRFCFNTHSNVMYVSDNAGSQVTAIQSDDTILGSVTVGSGNTSAPTEMGYLPSTKRVYIAVQNSNEVAIVKESAFKGQGPTV